MSGGAKRVIPYMLVFAKILFPYVLVTALVQARTTHFFFSLPYVAALVQACATSPQTSAVSNVLFLFFIFFIVF